MIRHIFSAATGRALLPALLCLSASAAGHEVSMAEIRVDGGDATVEVELDAVDLDFVLGIRGDGSEQLSVGDVRGSAADIERYILNRVSVEGCVVQAGRGAPGVRMTFDPRIVVPFDLRCADASGERLVSSRVFEELPGYRTAVTIATTEGTQTIPLQNGTATIALSMRDPANTFPVFIKEGWQHIFAGFDHLLFLLLLVLPVVRSHSLRTAAIQTAGVVSAFTVAHSITLALSTYGYLSLPAHIVEPVIAASIVLAAVLNLVSKSDRLLWPVAYLFGLIHGFGFAGAFAELAAGATLRWTDLLGFNLGVELGQLAVTIAALGLLALVSRLRYAGRLLVPAGSTAIGAVGVAWFAERVF